MSTIRHAAYMYSFVFFLDENLIRQGLAYGQTRQQELIWYAYPEDKKTDRRMDMQKSL